MNKLLRFALGALSAATLAVSAPAFAQNAGQSWKLQTGAAGAGGWYPPVPLGARNNMSIGIAISNPFVTVNVSNAPSIEFINKTGTTINYIKVVQPFWKPINSGSFTAMKKWLIDSPGSGYTAATIAATSGCSGGVLPTFDQVVVSGGQLQSFIARTIGACPANDPPILTVSGDGTGATAHVELYDPVEQEFFYGFNLVANSVEYPEGSTPRPVTYNHGTRTSTSAPTASLKTLFQTVSDETFIPGGIPNGAKFRVRLAAQLGITLPVFGAFTKDGNNALTSVPITSGGAGACANTYTFPVNNGGRVIPAAVNAYSYNCSIVYTEVTVGGEYTAAPSTVLNWIIDRQMLTDGSPVGDQTNGALTDTVRYATSWTQLGTSINIAPFVMARTAAKVPAAIVVGASQDAGFGGGDSQGDEYDGFGYWSRRFGQAGIGMLKRTLPGEYCSNLIQYTSKMAALVHQAPGAKNGYSGEGYNDLQRGDSDVVVETCIITSMQIMRAWGLTTTWQALMLPNSTTSDGWSSVAGQTLHAGWGAGQYAELVNLWLRDGMPIVAGVPAPTGTVNAIRAGQQGHPATGFVDNVGNVQAPGFPGYWDVVNGPNKTFQVYRALTNDGVHPSLVGHNQINGTTKSLNVTPGSGGTAISSIDVSGLPFAQLQLNFSGGAFTGCTLLHDNGVFYDYVPWLNILPLGVVANAPVGTGATGTITLSGGTSGTVTGCTLGAAGSGYTNGAISGVSGKVAPIVTGTVVGGGVQLSLDYGGSGVTSGYNITINWDGTGASATPNISVPIDLTRMNFLLRRDVDPAANDNDPMWLEKAA